MLHDLKRLDEALDSYGRALNANPDSEYLYGTWLHTKMKAGDWSESRKTNCVNSSRKSSATKKRFHRSCSWHIQTLWPCNARPQTLFRDRRPKNLRLLRSQNMAGTRRSASDTFSADFHNHATMYLMAELFERHDKKDSRLWRFQFGPDVNDEMRARVSAAFDRFIDVRNKSDTDIALLSRSLEIDIAVDLKGFTRDMRVGIFLHRAAPIQVNYLGYPGTMGAEYIDYLIADSTVIPDTSRQHYSQKICICPTVIR